MKPKILEEFKNTNLPLYNFLLNKWYIDEFYDKTFVNPSKKLGSLFWKKGDIGIIDRFGPDGISSLVINVSRNVSKIQTGFVYHYAFAMLIGLGLLLIRFVVY